MAYRDDYENDDVGLSASLNDVAKSSGVERLTPIKSEDRRRRYADSYDYDGHIDNKPENADGWKVVFEQEQIGNAEIKKSIGSDCQKTVADNYDFSWLWLIGVAVIAIVVSWIVSMVFPMVQAVLPAEGCIKTVVLGIMAFVPVLLILIFGIMVGVMLWKMYWRLPSKVDYRYADFEGREADLRKKLREKYLRYFKKRKDYGQIVGIDAYNMVDELLDPSNDGDIEEWFARYKEFQNKLIEQAKHVRDKYAMAVGAFTALSRQSKLDAASVFFFSTLMVFEMAKIFNKRMSKIGALKTVILYSVNILAASQIQAVGGKVVKIVFAGLGGIFGAAAGANAAGPGGAAVGATGGAKMGAAIGEKVGSLAAVPLEYGINKYLAEQFGDRAIKEFVAVKYDEDNGK